MLASSGVHGRKRGGRRWLRRLRNAAILLLVVVLAAVVFVAVQLARSVGGGTARATLPATARIPGAAPRLPWPSTGAAAVSIEGVGSLGSVKGGVVTPLASVTKLVTALVVLHDHPLAATSSGPSITITPADVATYKADVATKQSVLMVSAGEKLTERQALEGLLIPSANNIADVLAVWDAGSISGFVPKMNAEASSLGLKDTHFVGPSGLNAGNVGTADSMVRLAAASMASPVLAAIVAEPQAVLPVAGKVINFDYDVGHNGIIGIKTGSTGPAGGNFVFAARRKVDGRTLTALGAVLGQGGVSPIQTALAAGEKLASAALSFPKTVTVLPAGATAVTVRTPWGATLTGRTKAPLDLFGIPGTAVSVHTVLSPLLKPGGVKVIAAGQQLGTVEVSVGSEHAETPIDAAGSLRGPSLSYRLTRL